MPLEVGASAVPPTPTVNPPLSASEPSLAPRTGAASEEGPAGVPALLPGGRGSCAGTRLGDLRLQALHWERGETGVLPPERRERGACGSVCGGNAASYRETLSPAGLVLPMRPSSPRRLLLIAALSPLRLCLRVAVCRLVRLFWAGGLSPQTLWRLPEAEAGLRGTRGEKGPAGEAEEDTGVLQVAQGEGGERLGASHRSAPHLALKARGSVGSRVGQRAFPAGLCLGRGPSGCRRGRGGAPTPEGWPVAETHGNSVCTGLFHLTPQGTPLAPTVHGAGTGTVFLN